MRPQTIAAIATAPGRGAIAIVRCSGPDAAAIARGVFRSNEALVARRAVFGRIVDHSGATLDRGLALWFDGPHSYTGEDVLELHVHGAPVVARQALVAMLESGARLAGPGEFTRRAFANGRLSLDAAEAVGELIAAEHASAARAAAAQLGGGLGQEVSRWRAALGEVLEELAATLDFPDEVPEPPRSRLRERIATVRGEIGGLAQRWERGRLVREGASVAIVGPPNAGKSSLLNALLGAQRAIVSEMAGTTRDTIEESLALDGHVVRLIDTAGIRAHADRLEGAGIARSESALSQARIAVVVVDGSTRLSEEARSLLARTRARPRVVLFNKADLGRAGYDSRDSEERDALWGSSFDPQTRAAVSTALEALLATDDRIDLERPSLATARQADVAIRAERALYDAEATLDAGAPIDLLAGDLANAVAALDELSGSDASEALLDAIFARFCIGK